MFGWLPALIVDSRRLDLHRRRARHDGAHRLDPPQGPLDRRSRPRPHEPAVVHPVPDFHLDRAGVHHRGVHRYHGRRRSSACRRSENGETGRPGGGIATSSLLYLALPIVMGLLLRYTRLSLGWATLIFLPLVGVAIWVGQYMPLDLAATAAALPTAEAHTRFGTCCCWATAWSRRVVPVWLLLQPRGHLGGYFLYVALAGRRASACCSAAHTIQYPAFTGWTFTPPAGAPKEPFSVPVHHDRLRRVLRISLADRFRHDVEAAARAKPTPGRSATARCCSKRWWPCSRCAA